MQAAESARQAGADNATIAAALLHDIGHFLPFSTAKDMVQDGLVLGKASHEAVGEAYLKQLGFPKEVYELVGAHVAAKRQVIPQRAGLTNRYITATNPAYYESLSDASKKSLKYQGGPFDAEQVRQFEADPLHKQKVALRMWDDEAKRTDIKAPGLETFRDVVASTLA